MAFCPQCGREQKCGCEECHDCGVKLVERRPQEAGISAPRREAPGEQRAVLQSREPMPPALSGLSAVIPDRLEDTGVRRDLGGRLLPTLMVVLGAAVLAITLIEMIRTANGFVSQGLGFSSGSLRRLGFYVGSVLYSGSARVLLGFALVVMGMLFNPPRPLAGRASWHRGMLVVGTLMGLTSTVCFITIIFLVIPGGGTASLAVRSSLPSLVWAIPALLVVGLSLLWASYLTTARAADIVGGDEMSDVAREGADGGDRHAGSARREDSGSDLKGMKAAPVKSYFGKRGRRK